MPRAPGVVASTDHLHPCFSVPMSCLLRMFFIAACKTRCSMAGGRGGGRRTTSEGKTARGGRGGMMVVRGRLPSRARKAIGSIIWWRPSK